MRRVEAGLRDHLPLKTALEDLSPPLTIWLRLGE
jgi:hypothetical protein